jgi:hypothetical protein
VTQPGYYDPNQAPPGYGQPYQPQPQGYQPPPPQYGPPPQQPYGYAPPAPQGYGQAPVYGQAPPPPSAPPVPQGTIDDYYNQPNTGGGPAISWSAQKGIVPGYRVVGMVPRKITNGDVVTDTDPKTKQIKTNRDGSLKRSLAVPMRLLQPDFQAPEGEARVFLRGQLKEETARAMAEAGCDLANPDQRVPEEGCLLDITLVERKPTNSIPQNIFVVKYFRPGTWDPNAFVGQQAPAQAPQQYNPQQGYQQAAPPPNYPQAQQGQYAPNPAQPQPGQYQQQPPTQYAPPVNTSAVPQGYAPQAAAVPQGQPTQQAPQSAPAVASPAPVQAPQGQHPPAAPSGAPNGQMPADFSPQQQALLAGLLAQQQAAGNAPAQPQG